MIHSGERWKFIIESLGLSRTESGGHREESHSQQDWMAKAQRWENGPHSGRGEVAQLNGAWGTLSRAQRPGPGARKGGEGLRSSPGDE